MTTTNHVKGYIWYDPEAGFYQKGSTIEFQRYYSSSTRKKDFQILFEITGTTSDLLAYRLVKQLNKAKKDLMHVSSTAS